MAQTKVEAHHKMLQQEYEKQVQAQQIQDIIHKYGAATAAAPKPSNALATAIKEMAGLSK